MADSPTPNIFETQNPASNEEPKKPELGPVEQEQKSVIKPDLVSNTSRANIINVANQITEIEIDTENEEKAQVTPNQIQEIVDENQTNSTTTASLPQQSQATNSSKPISPESIKEARQIINDLTPEQKLMAAIAYMSFLVFIPITQDKKDEYIDFHIKQGLVLAVADFVLLFMLGIILQILPRFLGDFLLFVAVIAVMAGHIYLIFKALSGEKFLIPQIGALIQKINLQLFRKKTTILPSSSTSQQSTDKN